MRVLLIDDSTTMRKIQRRALGTLGIEDIDGTLAFQLYPTLVKDIIYIETQLQEFEIGIYNVQGQRIGKFNSKSSLDLSHLSSGLYFVQLRSSIANVETTIKIVKQ